MNYGGLDRMAVKAFLVVVAPLPEYIDACMYLR
jgi:hypothetical protein